MEKRERERERESRERRGEVKSSLPPLLSPSHTVTERLRRNGTKNRAPLISLFGGFAFSFPFSVCVFLFSISRSATPRQTGGRGAIGFSVAVFCFLFHPIPSFRGHHFNLP